jgi:hypothetical protein
MVITIFHHAYLSCFQLRVLVAASGFSPASTLINQRRVA